MLRMSWASSFLVALSQRFFSRLSYGRFILEILVLKNLCGAEFQPR